MARRRRAAIMIIPLTLPPESSSPNGAKRAFPSALARLGSSEFFLLELQGELEFSGDKHGQLVGRLTIDDDGKGSKPTLRIGHHLLEGKIANLPKPLAILQQQRTCAPPPPPTLDENGDIDDGGDVDMRHGDNYESKDGNESTPQPAIASATATSYAIHTLVRKKIIFSKRPTPMVGLSAKTTT